MGEARRGEREMNCEKENEKVEVGFSCICFSLVFLPPPCGCYTFNKCIGHSKIGSYRYVVSEFARRCVS